jgi:hypothetical protein
MTYVTNSGITLRVPEHVFSYVTKRNCATEKAVNVRGVFSFFLLFI